MIQTFFCGCSATKSCPTLCDSMDCSTPAFSVLHYLPDFAQIHVHWVSDAIWPSHLLTLLLLPSIFPTIRVFSNELALHNKWPKFWSFSFNISPSNEYSLECLLISFRINWFDLLCSPRDSQVSSPAPQLETINSLALSLLYGLTLTSVHDYWKNHSLDYMDLGQQSDVFAF